MAIGYNTTASTANQIAIGNGTATYRLSGLATATGSEFVVVDSNGDLSSTTLHTPCTEGVFGSLNCGAGSNAVSVAGSYNTAIGQNASAEGINSIALGTNTNSDGRSIAIGELAKAGSSGDLTKNISVGYMADASSIADDSGPMIGVANIAIGAGSNASGADSNIAIGDSAEAIGASASAIGRNAKANSEAASAFGAGATALHQRSTAIGRGRKPHGITRLHWEEAETNICCGVWQSDL